MYNCMGKMRPEDGPEEWRIIEWAVRPIAGVDSGIGPGFSAA